MVGCSLAVGVECAWVEVIVIAHGPRSSLLARVFFLSYLLFLFRVWLHIHRRPRTYIRDLHYMYTFLFDFLHIL